MRHFREERSSAAHHPTTWGLKQLPKHAGECLLEVIIRRYENRSTIMTSNRPLDDWWISDF